MSTETGREATTTRLAVLPRVNLLPPEIEERRRFKKLQGGLGIAVVAAAGVVGALVLVANGQVGDAQSELDTQTSREATLQAEAATYAEVPAVYAQVDAAQARLTQAMGMEIRWSQFLNDLSLITPGRVWLTGVTAAETVDTTAVGVVAAAPGTYGSPNIGTLTFQGKGSTHNDVAAWLRSLGSMDKLADPYFTSSTREKIGAEDAVTFSSQAVITEGLLSHRFTDKAGG